ncbi:hypothetical protein HOY34_14015 [Xinfangfangia sp. D13-10-4-6]|uniref:hypothetical protein n=1 Tax=Pseudogemmobacter hezensis TaxID=2737662 RepID=UPI001554EA12|nr:hypothetical protein [Pseudogemmobacter hezensis]NPD16311.1 hypothetical protein [Pseudogemmobacter hezensis]
MTKNSLTLVFSAALLLTAAPVAAQTLSKEQLLQLAVERGVCKGDLVPVEASYSATDATRISVTCGEATAFAPALGALGAGGAAAAAGAAGLVVMAAGGGSSPSTTPSTN